MTSAVEDGGQHPEVDMIGMAISPAKLFFAGKLFKDSPKVLRQLAVSAAEAAKLNVPTGIAAWRGGLAVCDAWNHRVLLWHEVPTHSGQKADIVRG